MKKLFAWKVGLILGVFILVVTMVSSMLAGVSGSVSGGLNIDCDTSPSGTASLPAASTDSKVEVAKKIAAVLTEFGLDKNKVYGAIGNGEQESSLMAPFVELNYIWPIWKNASSPEEAAKEINKYGTRAEDLFINGWGSVLSAYPTHRLDGAAYVGGDPKGGHWVGFGIWQWTGFNGVKPYFDWADANKLEKANIDNILAFAVGDNSNYFKPYTSEGDYYYKRLVKIRDMPAANSPAEGADIWLGNYEFADGRTASSGSNEGYSRIQYATNWAIRLEKETLDSNYAKSILSIANTTSAKKNADQNSSDCEPSSSSSSDGGHPYKKDYYWTAAFRSYNKARTIGAASSGNNWHNGIDLVAEWNKGFGPKTDNKEIVSVFNGTIVSKSPGFGQILIKSDPPDTKLDKPVILEYTHMLVDSTYNKWNVGDKVQAGEQIGVEGDTGSPGLHHLHFGVLNSEAFYKGYDLWRSGTQIDSNYGSSVDNILIDPGLVLKGIEPGWMDTGSNNYLGDAFIQPNPLKIRVDGKTIEDPRMKGKN